MTGLARFIFVEMDGRLRRGVFSWERISRICHKADIASRLANAPPLFAFGLGSKGLPERRRKRHASLHSRH
jgi:hypothetical protein